MASGIGFLCFVVIGRNVPVYEYGLFISAFSIHSLLHSFGSGGIPIAAIRLSKKNSGIAQTEYRSDILFSGLIFQLVQLLVISFLYILLLVIVPEFFKDYSLFSELIIIAGAFSSVLFEYMLVLYAVQLQFPKISALRIAVSIIRIITVLVVLYSVPSNPAMLLVAFLAPPFFIVLFRLPEFYKAVWQQVFELSKVKEIAAYSFWQTCVAGMSSSVLLITPLMIMNNNNRHGEIGLFGLAMSLSFVYSITGNILFSYFLPQASSSKNDEEISRFIREGKKILAPVLVIGLGSLYFSDFFLRIAYGEVKSGIVPVYVLLSLSGLISIVIQFLVVILNYYYKSKAILTAHVSGMLFFICIAVILDDRSAVNLSVAVLLSKILLFSVLLKAAGNKAEAS